MNASDPIVALDGLVKHYGRGEPVCGINLKGRRCGVTRLSPSRRPSPRRDSFLVLAPSGQRARQRLLDPWDHWSRD